MCPVFFSYQLADAMYPAVSAYITGSLSITVRIYLCTFHTLLTRFISFPAGAIIFTIIALLSIFAYFGYRSRIPLASLLLQVVMDVAKHHKSVYVVAFIALLFQAALSVCVSHCPLLSAEHHVSLTHSVRWYTFTVIATYAKWTPGNSCMLFVIYLLLLSIIDPGAL